MSYDLKSVEATWAAWTGSLGVLAGAVASQVGADEALAIAVAGVGAATGRVLTILIRRALAKVGLGPQALQ